MCAGFTTNVYRGTQKCAESLLNHLRAVVDAFCPLRNQRRKHLRSEVFLIATTLLMVKSKNIYRSTTKIHVVFKCISENLHKFKKYTYVLYMYVFGCVHVTNLALQYESLRN